MVSTLAASVLSAIKGTTSTPRPPRVDHPPHSVRAKALQALWWALRPYLFRVEDGSATVGEVEQAQGSSSRTVRVSSGGSSPYATAVVNFNSNTKALTLSFRKGKELAAALHHPEAVPLSCIEASAPKAKVNKGFAEALQSLLGSDAAAEDGPLSQACAKAMGADKPVSILCTGYGMGGGLAPLAAVRMALKYPLADVSCVTFGSPNIGNQEFAEAFSMLVGFSVRLEHNGDPFTLLPTGSWTAGATCDVKCGVENKEDRWENHKLANYLKALLSPEFAHPEWLPHNAPGVFLMVQPATIKESLEKKPFPIDLDFVPDAGVDNGQLASPYDVLVELDGQAVPVKELFLESSGVWQDALVALCGADAVAKATGDLRDEGLEPGKVAPPRARPGERFHNYLPPSFPSPAGASQMATDATSKNKAEEAKKKDDLDAVEFLDYLPPSDLAGQKRIFDKLAAYRLPIPLLLATCAYRDSPTAKRVITTPEGKEEPALPMLFPDGKAKKGDPHLNDPFGGAIRELIARGDVLGYRMVDDCEFQRKKEDGRWEQIKDDQRVADNRTDTQAYVLWMKDGTAVFAFRGTSCLKDWLTNADVHLKNLGKADGDAAQGKEVELARGSLHQGFLRGFCSVSHRGVNNTVYAEGDYKAGDLFARNLVGVLKELMAEHPLAQQGPARVMCVGHSLGGALATVCAAWAAEQYPLAPVSLYTFGQPRVADKQFVTYLDQSIGTSMRVVHRLDPVPLVPLNHRLFPPLGGKRFFHHFPAGMLRCGYGERLLAFFSRLIPGDEQFYVTRKVDLRLPLTFLLSALCVSDHFMNNYHDQFRTAMGKLGAQVNKPAQVKNQ